VIFDKPYEEYKKLQTSKTSSSKGKILMYNRLLTCKTNL